MGRFRFREDIVISDSAVEAAADSLDDLFETAASSLAELMVDPKTIQPTVVHSLRLEAPSLDLLLFEWLSELVMRKDADSEVFVRTLVHVAAGEGCVLEADLIGGRIVPGQTDRRADVKGVTLHRLSVERDDGGWRATFVFDL
jgi:SHS2 domain-containing protein